MQTTECVFLMRKENKFKLQNNITWDLLKL